MKMKQLTRNLLQIAIGGVIGLGTRTVVKTVVASAVKDIGVDIDSKTQIFLDIGAAAIGIAMSAWTADRVADGLEKMEDTIQQIKNLPMKSAELVEESTQQEAAE